jgi:hypothetical protein
MRKRSMSPNARQKVIELRIGSYRLIVKTLVLLFVHLINMAGAGWILSHGLARSRESN